MILPCVPSRKGAIEPNESPHPLAFGISVAAVLAPRGPPSKVVVIETNVLGLIKRERMIFPGNPE